jgi:hypothetical protein
MYRNITFASLGLAASVVAGGILAGVSLASAEDIVTTTKTTTYAGTVSDIRPSDSTIILRSDASPDPVTYNYTKETTFVDQNGRTVTHETIRNAPVRVEYVQDGGRTIVRRVVQTGPATVVVPAPAAPVAPVVEPGTVIREKTTREID